MPGAKAGYSAWSLQTAPLKGEQTTRATRPAQPSNLFLPSSIWGAISLSPPGVSKGASYVFSLLCTVAWIPVEPCLNSAIWLLINFCWLKSPRTQIGGSWASEAPSPARGWVENSPCPTWGPTSVQRGVTWLSSYWCVSSASPGLGSPGRHRGGVWGAEPRACRSKKGLVLVLLHENGSSHIASWVLLHSSWGGFYASWRGHGCPTGFAFSRDDGHVQASPWLIHRKSRQRPPEPHPLLGSRSPERGRLTSGQRPPPLWSNSNESGGSRLIGNKKWSSEMILAGPAGWG